jgi:hypothetical protein
MPGVTIGTQMHGPTEIAVDAQFQLVTQDGKYSLQGLFIRGEDQGLVERVHNFLNETIAELNEK